MATATQTAYAQFNSLTLTGRVFATKVVDGKNGKFLAVTLITNIANDRSVTVTFNDSQGIMALEANGKLPVGRIVTIQGTLDGISETYIKDGAPVMRKRPEVKLVGTSIPRGGLGAMPKSATEPTRVIAGTPVKVGTPVSDLTPESAYSENEADASVAQVDDVPAIF